MGCLSVGWSTHAKQKIRFSSFQVDGKESTFMLIVLISYRKYSGEISMSRCPNQKESPETNVIP
jgi:hypothetical protein